MYQALYRKWRPKRFDDMVGQEHVRAVLAKEVETEKLAHAYLFCGTHGSGKTSAAKILAKAINCERPSEGNPCNECEICIGIDNESIMDVREIDAASNNGVDNIRDIRDEVRYSPSKAKYRVYIIDEAHMLSIAAFNALLKTLEEPPSYVVFMLATTEYHKIPATILSRCQSFMFGRISDEDIISRINTVCKGEGLIITEAAAKLIARLADGAMRNALSILEQCAARGSNIDEETVALATSLTQREYLFEISTAVARMDGAKAVEAITYAAKQAKDMTVVATEIVEHFRDLLVILTVTDYEEILLSPPSEFDSLREVAKGFTPTRVLKAIEAFQAALREASKTAHKKVAIEVAALSLCSAVLQMNEESLLGRIEALEKKIESGDIKVLQVAKLETEKKDASATIAQATIASAEDTPPWDTEDLTAKTNEGVSTTQKTEGDKAAMSEKVEKVEIKQGAETASPAGFWSSVTELAIPSLRAILSKVKPEIRGNKLILYTADSFAVTMLNRDSAKEEIAKTVKKVTNNEYEIDVQAQNKEDVKVTNPLFDKLVSNIERIKEEEKQ